MVTAEFSEFSFGYALTDSLVQVLKSQLGVAPVFPSLQQEGSAGGGYDVHLPAIPFPLFLQFKIPQVLSRQSTLCPPGYWPPYYRMPLRTQKPNQHQLLLDLCAAQPSAMILYASPLFHKVRDLDKHYLSKSVHQNTAFIEPARLGRLDDKAHHVSYKPGAVTYWRHSEPTAIETGLNLDSMVQAIETRRKTLQQRYEVNFRDLSHADQQQRYFKELMLPLVTWFSARIAERGRRADASKFEDTGDISPRGLANRLAYMAQVHFGLTLALIDASNRQPD